MNLLFGFKVMMRLGVGWGLERVGGEGYLWMDFILPARGISLYSGRKGGRPICYCSPLESFNTYTLCPRGKERGGGGGQCVCREEEDPSELPSYPQNAIYIIILIRKVHWTLSDTWEPGFLTLKVPNRRTGHTMCWSNAALFLWKHIHLIFFFYLL